MDAILLTIAQQAENPIDVGAMSGRLMLWGAILIALIVVGGAGVMLVRKWVMAQKEERETEGFSLADLRGLRERGELTEQEYAAARAKTAARVKAEVLGRGRKPGAKSPEKGELG